MIEAMPDERPRPTDDLPPVPPVGADDEAVDLPEGEDLLGELVDERTGEDLLDDRTGESEEVEALEDDLAAEDGWTDDSDADERAPDGGDDGGHEADSESEDGWTEDGEGSGTDDWDDDLLPGGPDGETRASEVDAPDGGDEGSDEPDLGAADLEPAPLEMEADEEEPEPDSPDPPDPGEEGDDDAPWVMPAAVDPTTVLVRHLGPSDQALAGVAAGGGEVWAAGGDAFCGTAESLSRFDDPALEGVLLQSVAVLEEHGEGHGPVSVVFGSAIGGCFVRHAGGTRFEAANGWAQGRPRAPFFVLGWGHDLLGRSGDGRLFRSADVGRTWQRLDPGGPCLAALGVGALLYAVVQGSRGIPTLARSTDGGATFAHSDLSLGRRSPIGPDCCLAAWADRIVLVSEEIGAPLASEDGGRTFLRWPCPAALAAAIAPAGSTAYLSLFHAAQDRGALAVTRDFGRTFETIVELSQLRRVFRLDEPGDPDGDNRIHGIAIDPTSPDRVYLASAAGAFVVAVRSA